MRCCQLTSRLMPLSLSLSRLNRLFHCSTPPCPAVPSCVVNTRLHVKFPSPLACHWLRTVKISVYPRGPGLHYYVDLRIQTYTEPVTLKCGKFATMPVIYWYFTVYPAQQNLFPSRLINEEKRVLTFKRRRIIVASAACCCSSSSVCLSVCLSVRITRVYWGKTADSIEMILGVGPSNDGVQIIISLLKVRLESVSKSTLKIDLYLPKLW